MCAKGNDMQDASEWKLPVRGGFDQRKVEVPSTVPVQTRKIGLANAVRPARPPLSNSTRLIAIF
jgi:hypothetical protein